MIPTDRYIKSTFSGNGGCVEVRRTDLGSVLVRDSKNPEREPHEFNTREWWAFIEGIRNGEFDL